MPFLLMDGDLTLKVEAMEEGEPELVGDESRADNGALRGAITAEKRTWTASLVEMTQSEYATLRGRVTLGRHVTISGDGVPSTTVRVRLRSIPYLRTGMASTAFTRVVQMEMVEV